MASLGHIAVGLAAARFEAGGVTPSRASMALWSALSLLPDIDVVGFASGVEYGAPWGHRGATHSLVLAVAAGIGIGAAAPRFNRRAVRTGLIAAAVVASHGLLDTMTDGGLGCALFWPFELTRYFAPWRPIPVAPIGVDFISPGGLLVALAEVGLFLPALLYAIRPRQLTAKWMSAVVVLWLAALMSISSSEQARNRITGLLLREDTEFTAGFDEAAFQRLEAGQSAGDVRNHLGDPRMELWSYLPSDGRPPDERPAPPESGCLMVRLVAGLVAAAHHAGDCRSLSIVPGMTRRDVERRLGVPVETCWQYSWSPGPTYHRMRIVCFEHDRVHLVVRKWSGL